MLCCVLFATLDDIPSDGLRRHVYVESDSLLAGEGHDDGRGSFVGDRCSRGDAGEVEGHVEGACLGEFGGVVEDGHATVVNEARQKEESERG